MPQLDTTKLYRACFWGRRCLSAALRVSAPLSVLALLASCAPESHEVPDLAVAPQITARLSLPNPPMLNIAPADECPPYVQEELKEPVEIFPIDGVLETQLIVAMKERCVPVFDVDDNVWTLRRLSLRTYGFPKDHAREITAEQVQADLGDENFVWSAPGPTFVLTKASAPGVNDGTNFKMTLFNALAPQADPHACDELLKLPNPDGTGGQGPFFPDTEPNCFHGDNSTNFHFHGFHVSPQPHQDWVGLELLPFGSAEPEHAVHKRGEAAIGEYPFNVDRLRYTQAEGTHWYHAHKHGSTALQVLNGLVGTFLVLGEFDAQLDAFYADQGGLVDRLLVVQQIQERPPGLGGDRNVALPLVNGMANPVVKMKPGEIQRWRFVGATMQASAQLEIGFPQGTGAQSVPEVRQIAMDGVQFAPENYACQPILYGPDCQAGTEDDSFKALESLVLDPGTRIDFLIQAPDTPGRHAMTFRMTGNLQDDVAEELAARIAAVARVATAELAAVVADDGDPPLLTLEVVAAPPVDYRFPTEAEFPPLPAFLDNIEGPFLERTVSYEMNDQRGQLDTVRFAICGVQYDPSCVNETLTLEKPEAWTLTNNSSIAHPFHIHTNPFQLISDGAIQYNSPFIWRDTVAIPTGTPEDPGEALIHYVATEFTGEFVNHCHILGHEDRGMMHNVQAVCENGEWGKPTSDLSSECREGNFIPAAPDCAVGNCL